jgi:DNA invertase Pin-like site-specific DNA recombinase
LKVIGYIRVSTEQQADEGVSLEAQEAQIRAYCATYGHELIGIEADAASASSLDRDGLTIALARLTLRQADALVVCKMDRLSRSVGDLPGLLDRYFAPGKHTLISVTEHVDTSSAAGRMLLNMLTVVSQWEREVISERTRAALRHKKAKGERVGTIPYGYSLAADGIRLEPHPGEQRIVALIGELRASGMSLRAIVDELNRHSEPAARGARWHLTTVARIARAA